MKDGSSHFAAPLHLHLGLYIISIFVSVFVESLFLAPPCGVDENKYILQLQSERRKTPASEEWQRLLSLGTRVTGCMCKLLCQDSGAHFSLAF